VLDPPHGAQSTFESWMMSSINSVKYWFH